LAAVSSLERCLIPGGIAAFELFMLWQIWKAMRDGVITIDFSNSNRENDLFNITAHRETAPIVFWLMLVFEVIVALALLVAVFFALRTNFGAKPV
jgi:hypothetical protein